MEHEIAAFGSDNGFENIKKIDENGIEYWTARELFPLLGYARWETFEDVISRAQKAALNSVQIVENHFRRLTKIAEVGSNKNPREIKDWKLDRYACYLIAQNGDSKIQAIALVQTHFAIQTRKQEIFEQSSEIEKRIRSFLGRRNKREFPTSGFSMTLVIKACMACLLWILKGEKDLKKMIFALNQKQPAHIIW